MDQKWAFFSFRGRMRRKTYWLYSLPVLCVTLPVFLYGGGNTLLDVLSLVIIGFAWWASAALNVKRLHDRNKSGWWVLVTFLPVIGPLYVIIELGSLDGTAGPNRFGPDPKGRSGKGNNAGPSNQAEDSSTMTMEG